MLDRLGHCYLITWFTGPPTLAKKGRQKNKIALAHYILFLPPTLHKNGRQKNKIAKVICIFFSETIQH